MDDRILLTPHEPSKAPIMLGDKRDELTFEGFLHVGIAGSRAIVVGDVKKMELEAGHEVKNLIIHGGKTAIMIEKGGSATRRSSRDDPVYLTSV